MTDLQTEIEKIKYQISLIGSALSLDKHPIPSLVIQLGWSEKDLNDAHDIFEKYDALMQSNTSNATIGLESDLTQRFNIGYQTVKIIVLAFYKNHQWIDVCIDYAKSHDCIEFHEITKNH